MNSQNLQNHLWKNRVFIVKTSDITSKKYQDQLNEFKNSKEALIDRKVILYQITGNDYQLVDFKNSALNTSGKTSETKLSKILNEKENFEIILIGLDGGVKLRQTEVLLKEDLFKTIDVMPMRRGELRRNRNNNSK